MSDPNIIFMNIVSHTTNHGFCMYCSATFHTFSGNQHQCIQMNCNYWGKLWDAWLSISVLGICTDVTRVLYILLSHTIACVFPEKRAPWLLSNCIPSPSLMNDRTGWIHWYLQVPHTQISSAPVSLATCIRTRGIAHRSVFYSAPLGYLPAHRIHLMKFQRHFADSFKMTHV